MAYQSDDRFVMGFPSAKPNQQLPPPGYPVPMPVQPGAYPPPPPAGFNGGYPAPSGSKNYVSPSFNVWYDSRNYGQVDWAGPDEDNGKKFGRVMLVTMVTLIVSMCMVSFVIWFLFGMEIPEFHVANLAVSNLTVTDTLIVGNWDANVTVYNPNEDVKVSLEPVRASLFYKNSPLGMASVEPFNLQGKRVYNLGINLDNEKAVSVPILSEQMNADLKNGFLYVSLRISLGARFASSSIWRKETLRVFCEDLKVKLAPGGDSGKLSDDAQIQTECLIFT
ncbi:OLC1v1034082C1 [Oldenlandia corymbosa var. corymbosa]|uniref:OLC1v1034082C1 n=1 Tax=Oldenlandia corymbosa var. corymbosa TaxID=529605 RepID=A0AAV1CQG5_OLDCO|nr:OLC1v1034082C1 [Oldenlandia corymbosa var. corymbosa]